MTMPPLGVQRLQGAFSQAGELFAIFLEGLRHTWRTRSWFWEFLEQCSFLIRVTTVPVILVSLPLGATVALQVGDLSTQLGAQSATSGPVMLGLVREVAPLASALIMAGAGGSAMTSDMGARRIRDELDAMEVLAVNPVHRLVTPRLWAGGIIAMLLASVVVLVGAVGGFLFNVLWQDVTPGAYFDNALSLLRLPDLLVTLLKAFLYGVIAATVACYRGMTCKRSPVGVGRAVNEATVITFLLVFALNYVITTIYFVAFPPKI